MNLTEQLTERRTNSTKVIPAEKHAIMMNSTANLKSQNLSKNALKTGQTFPSFTFKSVENKSVSLADFNSVF